MGGLRPNSDRPMKKEAQRSVTCVTHSTKEDKHQISLEQEKIDGRPPAKAAHLKKVERR
jgi:hypothetical protein